MKQKVALFSVSAAAAALMCLLAVKVFAAGSNDIALVPLPQKMERLKGTFILGPKTQIAVGKDAETTGDYLANRLRECTGLPVPVRTGTKDRKPGRNSILLTTNGAPPGTGPEAYELEVRPNSVLIRSSSSAGLFYGTQTLLQLMPADALAKGGRSQTPLTVPCVRIEDAPRFAYRGALLDVARHFFTVEELEKYIDEIAFHKINALQLHLTDDQGWRIEIKKYPRLTEVGGWRKSIGFNLDPKSSTAYGPDGRYGGFYTQAQMREVIAYAQARHVTVVPEIEMPGHGSAALAAYPQLSCSGGPYSTDMSAGVFAGVFCAGQEETFRFIADVLGEVSRVFPGPYIHIGGDEVNKENWHNCHKCQQRMHEENLKNEHELQSYFIRRVEKIVSAEGKRLIGWSEIREGGLAQNATVMDWIGGAVEAATGGHDVIMSPTSHCYLDYYQSRNRTNEPVAIGAFLPLHTVYSFDPIPAGLEARFRSHILGVQGNLWTEFIPSFKQVEYMTFPRLCALAEVGWSPKERRDWDDFVRRMDVHCQRLEALGINYRSGFFER